ncbi:MAG: ABC transporter permease [Clostridium sp.]
MSNLGFIVQEHKNNWYKIFKLSYYDFITPLRDTYLGVIWIILNPLTQIGVYWFVFGLGIRGGGSIDGHPFLLWMLAGLIPWFYISNCIMSGALSIYSKASILTKMKFPTSIIPTYNTLTQLMNNVPVIILMIVIYAFNGYKATPYYLQLIYYIFAATCIGISISLLTSALVIAIRDINKLIGTVIRFLFYLTPILWKPESMPGLMAILKLNPFIYVIDGFRNSLLYNKWFFEDVSGTIYFWVVTIIIFAIGLSVHMRLRNRFSDLV